jgi:predicted MPP superfamily phosphohydrolase
MTKKPDDPSTEPETIHDGQVRLVAPPKRSEADAESISSRALPDSKHSGRSEIRLALRVDTTIAGLDMASFELWRPEMSVGRIEPANIVLPHSSVSKLHAIFKRENGYRLCDLDSTNGTFVNELRIGDVPIKAGDFVRFGRLRFIVFTATGTTEQAKLYGYPKTNIAKVTIPKDGVGAEPGSTLEWGPSTWRKLLPRAHTAEYGALRIPRYYTVISSLTEEGQVRLEQRISHVAFPLLDDATHVYKEVDGDDLCLLFASESGAALRAILPQVADGVRDCMAAGAPLQRITPAWSTSSLDINPALMSSLQGTIPPPRSVPRKDLSRSEFRWIHISDLHFGAGTTTWRHDHEQVIAALIRDLSDDVFACDRILVTGDVAFSAGREQYDQSYEALRNLAVATCTTLAAVRVVPGNHDVDRSSARSPLVTALHRYARTSPIALDELISDPRSRSILLEKLAGFQAFVRKFGEHPSDLDWRERVTVAGTAIDIWGLCSVWASDADDGLGVNSSFVPNMPLGRAQYRDLARIAEPAAVNIIMSHHPAHWIVKDHAGWLRSAFTSRPWIHLCGHVHQPDGTAPIRLGMRNNGLVLVAGAAHAGQGDPAQHAYSRCILRSREGAWQVGWSPRTYDAERDDFRVDRNAFDLDENGFCWHTFAPGSKPRVS